MAYFSLTPLHNHKIIFKREKNLETTKDFAFLGHTTQHISTMLIYEHVLIYGIENKRRGQ